MVFVLVNAVIAHQTDFRRNLLSNGRHSWWTRQRRRTNEPHKSMEHQCSTKGIFQCAWMHVRDAFDRSDTKRSKCRSKTQKMVCSVQLVDLFLSSYFFSLFFSYWFLLFSCILNTHCRQTISRVKSHRKTNWLILSLSERNENNMLKKKKYGKCIQ